MAARSAAGCRPCPRRPAAAAMPSTALPWLLLALHIAVGLLASWWLRRGEAALHRLTRAVAAAAFRPLLFAVATACTAGAAAYRKRRPAAVFTTGGPTAARPLLHSVVRRGPPPVALAA